MSAPATHRSMTVQEWGLLILLSIIWGGSFFFTKIAVAEIPPLTIVFLRLALGAMVLNIILRSLKLSLPRDPKIWTAFLVMGLMNNMLPFTLLVWGQTHIASGLASILNATVPLFSIVIAHLFVRDEKASRLRIFGVALGFIGIVSMHSRAWAGMFWRSLPASPQPFLMPAPDFTANASRLWA
jgi:drug/metabolite transporter (DMT)-like permease